MTPIEQARNLGPRSGEVLRAVGVDTLEALVSLGWQEVCERAAAFDSAFVNLNFSYAVCGAQFDMDWRELTPELKAEARRLTDSLRR